MKGCGKIICGVLTVSSFLLLYVHGQTALFQLSYNIDKQSKVLARESEEYRRLKFEVEQMKAPLLLEGKMKEMSLELGLPKEVRVVRVGNAATLNEAPATTMPSDPLQTPSGGGLMRFLGRFVDIAQAKTDR